MTRYKLFCRGNHIDTFQTAESAAEHVEKHATEDAPAAVWTVEEDETRDTPPDPDLAVVALPKKKRT